MVILFRSALGEVISRITTVDPCLYIVLNVCVGESAVKYYKDLLNSSYIDNEVYHRIKVK